MDLNALMILAARAPQGPDRKAWADWEKRWVCDNPKPENEERLREEAEREVQRRIDAGKGLITAFMISAWIELAKTPWQRQFDIAAEQFRRDEWPLVWARRVYEAAMEKTK